LKRNLSSSCAASIAGLFLLCACAASAKPLDILTSFYPMYVSVLNVVGDTPGVEVTCLTEPQYPAKSAKVIERETGVRLSVLDPAVTGPRDPAAARDSYLAAMRKNLDVLRRALSE